MILFNKPPVLGTELKYINEALNNERLCGDGYFGHKCQEWFEEKFNCPKTLMTPNCTQALEMAAILIDIKPGDEVIMPSYTFVSTANAFVIRGAKIIFVDIRKDTMNIDETKIEKAITEKTKAIVPVHYAGVPCEMDIIMTLANKYNLFVIEDAAQGVMSTYKGKALGTIGDFGAYSFHETKNYTSGGEGGLLLINNSKFIKRAEIIREKGTDRSLFLRGMVDKYSWVDLGGSFLPSELQSAYLFSQLEKAELINDNRLKTWHIYYNKLSPLYEAGLIELPYLPLNTKHNAHMFYIKVANIETRNKLMSFLDKNNIKTAFHYIPLHTSKAGEKFSIFNGVDEFTTNESERLLRLPLYYGMSEADTNIVVDFVKKFIRNEY